MNRLKNYPIIQQLRDDDCGVAVLQSLLLYYGKHVKYSELSSLLEASNDGVTPDKLKDALVQHGIQYIPLHSCLDELKLAIDKGHPSLVLIQNDRDMYVSWEDEWKYGHWVAVIGYTKRSVILADPGTGKDIKMLFKDFERRWHDVGYERYAIVIQGGN
jgi:ABC-type bacteriocin/lantibiotic exporter with double-glycine peptidase domain